MNISALFNDNKASKTQITQVTGVCSKGPISAYVIRPEGPATRAPLMAIHGISRNAEELVEQFRPEAAANNQVIIVPDFNKAAWPVFQRITSQHRPDLALLALLNTLRQDRSIGDTRVERAERYVSLISHCQSEMGIPVTARLSLLENCGHDFRQCCADGGLIQMIRTSL